MGKEKTIDLDNGFELVINGVYEEHFNCKEEIVSVYGSDGTSHLFVRKKR